MILDMDTMITDTITTVMTIINLLLKKPKKSHSILSGFFLMYNYVERSRQLNIIP